jgi:hypothetical protein
MYEMWCQDMTPMPHIGRLGKQFLLIMVILTGIGAQAMAVEEAPYKVVTASGIFEVREYAPHILAEIVVDGDLEGAGNKAFRRLFKYISGENRSRTAIAMTAPVSQESKGEKIAMTAPVSQQSAAGKWAVSFMMPSASTLETLPIPDDSRITLRQVAAHRAAAVNYSGFWSEKNYLRYKQELDSWIKTNNFKVTGEPVWARYNPPFTPWFMRRNEILVPIAME